MNLTRIGLLIVIGAAGAFASPIQYTINFVTTSGIAPTAGTFSYDPISNQFSGFTVVWAGKTFDLTTSANNPTIINPTGQCPATAINFILTATD